MAIAFQGRLFMKIILDNPQHMSMTPAIPLRPAETLQQALNNYLTTRNIEPTERYLLRYENKINKQNRKLQITLVYYLRVNGEIKQSPLSEEYKQMVVKGQYMPLDVLAEQGSQVKFIK